MSRCRVSDGFLYNPNIVNVCQQDKELSDKEGSAVSLGARLKGVGKELASFVGGPAMRRISIITPINWVFSEIIYYGIIFNANNFSK